MVIDSSDVCYQVHNVSLTRLENANNLKKIFSERFNSLESKTVNIHNQKTLDNFCSLNPEFNVIYENKYNKFKYPEIGLWASSYLAIKKFINSDYKYLILCEDDMNLSNNFYDLFDRYSLQLPEDTDCFMLFKPENIFFNAGYEFLSNEHEFYTDSKDIWVAHQTWSTGCMMMTRKAAEIMLSYMYEGIELALDLYLLGPQQKQFNSSIYKRPMNVYSLSKDAAPMVSIKPYKSTIQSGNIIERFYS